MQLQDINYQPPAKALEFIETEIRQLDAGDQIRAEIFNENILCCVKIGRRQTVSDCMK
jgi:hypothetical protein